MKKTLASLLACTVITVAGCGSPESFEGNTADDDTIVIGSQDYYSNEIIAELYAQALEHEGFAVEREYRIGQREVYIKEIEHGTIDLFPEYTGPLLQYWSLDTSARRDEHVYEELQQAAPKNVRILERSSATDQDSYVVTGEFAQQYGIVNPADLAKAPGPLTLGANSEGEHRPYGPEGIAKNYGVEFGFTPVEDSGGPLTLKALQDGSIQLAIMYSASPAIVEHDLVALEDPAGLFLASHVVPVGSAKLDGRATEIINRVSKELTAADLLELNSKSIAEQSSADQIATDWLQEKQL